MKKTDLSIIIISYNTKNLLQTCLTTIFDSLTRTSLVVEIIVIDNASTDGSLEMVQSMFSKVTLIKNKENIGFGKANNQGIIEAQSDVVLLLNSDTEVKKSSIEKLYTYFLTLPDKSVVGGKLFNTDGSAQPSAGPQYTLTNIFVALFLKGDYWGYTRYSPNKTKKVDWIMGACMMTRKIAFEEVGGFDEGIFMYMEEIDWQYRAQKNGYQIFFYPEAHFIHIGAGSSKGRATPILNVFRGFLYYYDKHFPGVRTQLLRGLLVLKSLVAIVLFSVLGKKEDQKLYMDAYKIAVS